MSCHAFVHRAFESGFPADRDESGLIGSNVVFRVQMSCECRVHAVVILGAIPTMGVKFRKE